MGKPMFWADDDIDWIELFRSQNAPYQNLIKMDSMPIEQKQKINKAMRVQEKKSDQSFNSDSLASDSPDSMSSCLYDHTTLTSQNIEDAAPCFYFSASDESFLTDQCAAESDHDLLKAGGMCSNCNNSEADSCIVHHDGRHLDVCITCAAHCFKYRMPCPLCQLPIVYIYRYDNV